MATRAILTTQEDFAGEWRHSLTCRAYWPFNTLGSAGMVYDMSGHAVDGQIYNFDETKCYLADSKWGKRLLINQNLATPNQRIKFPWVDKRYIEGLQSFTLITWLTPAVYVADSGGWHILFTTRVDGTGATWGKPIFHLATYQGRLNGRIYGSDGLEVCNITAARNKMVANQLYMVAMTYNHETGQPNSGLRLYLNKTEVASWSTGGDLLNKTPENGVDFGWLGGTTTNYYVGSLDETVLEAYAFTAAELGEYYDRALSVDLNNVDAHSAPGEIRLKKQNADEYYATGIYTSPVIEITGGAFIGKGQLMVAGAFPTGTGYRAAKVRSADTSVGISSATWHDIGSNGILDCANLPFVQVQFELYTSFSSLYTPSITQIELRDHMLPPYEHVNRAFPIIYGKDEIKKCILDKGINVSFIDSINGEKYLEMLMSYSDPKRVHIENEGKVQLANHMFTIRIVDDDHENAPITKIFCEAEFYNLGFCTPLAPQQWDNSDPRQPMVDILKDTPWSVGDVEITESRNFSITDSVNPLSALRNLQNVWGGDLQFDDEFKLVHLRASTGNDNGVLLAYKKNMRKVRRIGNTRDFTERLYIYGQDGLTVASVNNGVPYLEDFSYRGKTADIRVQKVQDQRFTNPNHLKEWGTNLLNSVKMPKLSYIIEIIDLAALTGNKWEEFKLGDIVTVHDQVLGIILKTRIVKINYNRFEPWKSVVELSTRLKELGDDALRWTASADKLSVVDDSVRNSFAELTPFNCLLNSRAENGFIHWQNNGFEVDITQGVSGSACFKVISNQGEPLKVLSQVVTPSNRYSYSLSAQVAISSLEKGVDGRIGIEAVLRYKDGTSETVFLELG